MGCTCSTGASQGHPGSEHASIDESLTLMKECGERWRREPQKALNHFLKWTTEGDEYFGTDGSLFDYFQDDEYVELRTLLDEPLGRSHFLAHVDRFQPENVDLVRLWLLLHQYHSIRDDMVERFQSAKHLYKNYFHISPAAKQDAEDYRMSNCTPDIDEDEDEEASMNEKAEAAAFLVYHKKLVPERCRSFPPFLIALIIKLRPSVEQALVEARERLVQNDAVESPAQGRPRNYSSSLAPFVDLPSLSGSQSLLPTLPEINKIGDPNLELPTPNVKEGNTTSEIPNGVGNGNATHSEEGKSTTSSEKNDALSPNEVDYATDDVNNTTSNEVVEESSPPMHLFIDLQNEVFKEMKPLYHHFKITSDDYQAYRQCKKVIYNHVEPKDFKYIDVLGKGGFGQVVHVVKKSTGKHYAMKVQAKDTLIDTWGGKMQHVEIERDVLVAHRSFPFIVSLRYAFQDDKYAFLCLDLAENGSLRQLLDSAPAYMLAAPQVRLYVAEVVLALECLHDHEIIYRDLKPENVLLCADGHIMLADMGLAGFYYQDKYCEEDGIEDRAESEMNAEDDDLFDDSVTEKTNSDETGSECHDVVSTTTSVNGEEGDTVISESVSHKDCDSCSIPDDDEELQEMARDLRKTRTIKSHDTDCGTPFYRPPEMIRHEHYNEGVDWFMLGVFTYECLVGQLPFMPPRNKISNSGVCDIETDEDELRLYKKKLNIPSHVDQKTRELLEGLLDLDPKMRLGSGPSDLNRDLDSLKRHQYFWPLAGPLAKECDWTKVLNRVYKPVSIPDEKELSEKSHFSNFEALVRSWKRAAKKEAKELAKRQKKSVNLNIQALREGKPIPKHLEHYFDNWDYIDPESINLEKEAEKKSAVANEEPTSIERTLSRASNIRRDVSKSFKRVRDGFKRQRAKSVPRA